MRKENSSAPIGFIVLLLVTLGIFLHFYKLSLMEFKIDEIIALQEAQKIVDKSEFPLIGLTSSVGIPNPPVFLYFAGLFYWVSPTPVGVTFFIALFSAFALAMFVIAALNYTDRITALFFCFLSVASPWMLTYSRKIWAQDLLPFLMVLLFIALMHSAVKEKSKCIVFAPILLSIIAQMHYSGISACVSVVIFILIAVKLRRLNWAYFFIGCAFGLLLTTPFLIYIAQTGLSGMSNAITAKRAHVSDYQTAVHSLRLSGSMLLSDGIEYVMSKEFLSAFPELTQTANKVSQYLIYVLWISAMLSVPILIIPSRANLLAPPNSPLKDTKKIALFLTLLFLIVPIIFYSLLNVPVYPHYFIISAPFSMLFLAIFFSYLYDYISKFFLPIAASLFKLLLVMCISIVFVLGLLMWLAQVHYIESEGGNIADYGEAYKYQEAAATLLFSAGLKESDIRFASVRDDGIGIKYLLNQLYKKNPNSGWKVFKEANVHNRLIGKHNKIKCPSKDSQSIVGPYLICFRQ